MDTFVHSLLIMNDVVHRKYEHKDTIIKLSSNNNGLCVKTKLIFTSDTIQYIALIYHQSNTNNVTSRNVKINTFVRNIISYVRTLYEYTIYIFKLNPADGTPLSFQRDDILLGKLKNMYSRGLSKWMSHCMGIPMADNLAE